MNVSCNDRPKLSVDKRVRVFYLDINGNPNKNVMIMPELDLTMTSNKIVVGELNKDDDIPQKSIISQEIVPKLSNVKSLEVVTWQEIDQDLFIQNHPCNIQKKNVQACYGDEENRKAMALDISPSHGPGLLLFNEGAIQPMPQENADCLSSIGSRSTADELTVDSRPFPYHYLLIQGSFDQDQLNELFRVNNCSSSGIISVKLSDYTVGLVDQARRQNLLKDERVFGDHAKRQFEINIEQLFNKYLNTHIQHKSLSNYPTKWKQLNAYLRGKMTLEGINNKTFLVIFIHFIKSLDGSEFKCQDYGSKLLSLIMMRSYQSAISKLQEILIHNYNLDYIQLEEKWPTLRIQYF
mmetsp:Transcript_60154/g.69706  ORF Transcript_60154/g.69706 Transcript_60154/m.69706 type:complete len:351 (-) Transcript_60154:190-1242(-)